MYVMNIVGPYIVLYYYSICWISVCEPNSSLAKGKDFPQ